MTKPKLFRITSVAKYADNHRNVPVEWFVRYRPVPLFGPKGSTGLGYRDVMDCGGGEFAYPLPDGVCDTRRGLAVDEMFTEEEVNAFVKQAKTWKNFPDVTITEVELPLASNTRKMSAMPRGVCSWGWESRVLGYFDVGGCELMNEEEMENRRAIKRAEKNMAIKIIEEISEMTNYEGVYSPYGDFYDSVYEDLDDNVGNVIRSGKAAETLDNNPERTDEWFTPYMDDPSVIAHLLIRSIKRDRARMRKLIAEGKITPDVAALWFPESAPQ
jgi:hypothetical protein